MTAQPAETPQAPAVSPDLPKIRRHEAVMRGLVSVRELAEQYSTNRATVRRSIFAKDGAPQPVAVTAEAHRSKHEPLYRADEVDRFINSVQGTDGIVGRRRRSTPVPRVGLKTTRTGRLYQWRAPSGPTEQAQHTTPQEIAS